MNMANIPNQDLATIRTHLAAIEALLPSASIATADALNAAIAAANAGDTLVLDPALVYPNPFTITKPLTLVSSVPGTVRMAKDTPAPTFLAGMQIPANDVTLRGIAMQHTNPLTAICSLSGARTTFDRVRILGDPTKGGRRGIAANGGAMTFTRCFIDDCFGFGLETQAICAWDMDAGLTVDDSYLAGGSSAIMLGGADPSSQARIPMNVHVTNSEFGKNPAWYSMGVQIKNAFEVKNGINVYVGNCIANYAGIAEGQGAYLFVLTPRNQGNTAPYSTIKNVTIENITGGHAGGICNMLATDDDNVSGPLTGVIMRHCKFTNIDPTGIWKGSGRLFTFNTGRPDAAVSNVTLQDIQVTGQNLAAWGYFIGAAKGLTMAQMQLSPSKYGWKIDAGGMGRQALLNLMPDAILDSTIV
jgi:hypothetical protein